MTMLDLDFDEIPGATAPARPQATTRTSPRIVEQVTITPKASRTEQAYLARDAADWSWSDLRDYVVTKIQEIHGPQPRDHHKEMGIFKGFLSRWGALAPAIARHAYEVEGGWWRSSPIYVTRFCKGSDDYFSRVIAEKIVE